MTIETRIAFDPGKSKYKVYVRRGWGPVKWWEVVRSSTSYDSNPHSFAKFKDAQSFASKCATDVVFKHRSDDYVV